MTSGAATTPPAPLIVRASAAYRRMSWALATVGFATFALLYSVQPLLPLFAAQFGVPAAESSLAISFTTGAMALMFIPAGILSDRIGRVPIMRASLFAASLLTLLSAVLPGWHTLLAMRALTGLALAGVPSVAMAYVSEEVEGPSSGAAIGLYIAGSAIGGMAGRIGLTLMSDVFGWRPALGALGLLGVIAAILFWYWAPAAAAFRPRRHDLGSFMRSTSTLLGDRMLPLLFLEGFLLMGAFVTMYNYVGFRLELPPYALGQTAVGLIFFVYVVGSFSSAWFGSWAGRIGSQRALWVPIALLVAGIALTTASPLIVIIGGIAVITAGMFGAHSIASGWVARRAGQDRAHASSLYLLFYYLGSSVLGSAGGVAWSLWRWPGVAGFGIVLTGIAWAVAVRLARIEAPAYQPARDPKRPAEPTT
jgi:MFS transporter, YNFM family, putative membrane transport protein